MAQRVYMSEFWYLYGQTFRQMGRIKLWIPLLFHALVAVLLVYVHYFIFSPVTGPIVSAWTKLINSGFAPFFYHYPSHLTLLPYYFNLAQLVANMLIEAVLFGIMIDMLIALYRGEKPAFMVSVKHAFRMYLKLTLVWFIVLLILFLINRYFDTFLEDVIGYSLQDAPRRQMIAQLAARAITVAVYAVFVYILPSLMAGGASLWESIKRSIRLSIAHPFVALGLVLIPVLIGLLPSWILSDPSKIVYNFYPEMVLYLILISIGVDIVVNFILLGTSLKFYMDQSS